MTKLQLAGGIGRGSDGVRAIVKVKNFSGTSALFNIKLLESMLKVIKTMGIEEVEVGVDRESRALLFFMDEDGTIAYALAPMEVKKEEEEE